MAMSDEITEFVEDTVTKIVDFPDDLVVNVSVSTKNVIVQIGSAKSDLGKIIGKKGRTIESLKTIIMAVKNTQYPDDQRKINLEVLEDEDSSFTRQ